MRPETTREREKPISPSFARSSSTVTVSLIYTIFVFKKKEYSAHIDIYWWTGKITLVAVDVS